MPHYLLNTMMSAKLINMNLHALEYQIIKLGLCQLNSIMQGYVTAKHRVTT